MIILSQVWQNLKANKIRSFLTMFGIVWGVISIVILSALGEGFQRGNTTVLRELGKNILIIRNGRTSKQAGGERAGKIVRLEIGDVIALKQHAKLLEHVTPGNHARRGESEERVQLRIPADERRLAHLP